MRNTDNNNVNHDYYANLGEHVTLERVTPFEVILNPPEKLVLEVTTTGRYNFIQWTKNRDPAGFGDFQVTADNFAHFGEIYVQEETSMDDITVYSVDLNVFRAQRVPDKVYFAVIILGK